ncbi:MAG: DNA-processing protein DprA [Bacteroidetes bacterium]|nr:DNA-processing protein DprA [Bacteroidota bacterium]
MIYQIALTMIPGIGDVVGKKLVTCCGSAEAIFREKKKLLDRIPRIGQKILEALSNREILERAERELAFVEKFRIRPLFFLDKDYPFRLKNCIDSPILLYYKGTADLNVSRIIGVVGTRNATEYGKGACHGIISELAQDKVMIVSGLAYGIDSCAHRAALEHNLETIGVLGHGLDRIYPYQNKSLAERMLKNGGLLTDFISATRPDRENFPKRNRIIAGICDAVLVVEAAGKGGALITAEIANSYNRDVFAIPGRINDPFSEGTNKLIRQNKAALVQSADDIRYMMGWEQKGKKPDGYQKKFFLEMTPDETVLVDFLGKNGSSGIDDIAIQCNLSMSKTSAALLNLEFEGIVKSLPGKVYELT